MTLEWLAGFFDGEGCILATLSKRGSIAPYLIVANTHLPTLLAIRKEFGGYLIAIPKKGRPANWKQRYELRWVSQSAIDLIKKLLPFLVTKKEQAEFLLESWKPRSRESRYIPLTDEEKDKRKLLKEGLQFLKTIEYPIPEVLQ